MSDNVAKAERELEQAKLSAAYDEAVEAYRSDPSDANKAKKDDLANQLVAVRQAGRFERESETPGEGVASPGPVSAPSEVN
jgi:hypothetical protein